MKKTSIVTALWLASAIAASAQTTSGIVTGDQLLAQCTSRQQQAISHCMGYATGIADAIAQLAILEPALGDRMVRIPRDADPAKMAAAVTRYLIFVRDNPSDAGPKLNYAAAPLVMVALASLYRQPAN